MAAALVGVAAATVVKLLLAEAFAPTAPAVAVRGRSRQAWLDELQFAAQGSLYLADMQELNEDFAFAVDNKYSTKVQ